MVSCDTCFLTLALMSTCLVVSLDARSWDIAVAKGGSVVFFSQNGTEIAKSELAGAKMIRGLAYDNVTRTMFMSDTVNQNKDAIYSSNLTEQSSDPFVILNGTKGSQIRATAFDPVDRTLFWTDAQKRTVMKMRVSLSGDPNSPELLHDLKNDIPYGVTIDICDRFIYWSQCNGFFKCSIERSKLDGSRREVIVDGSMYDLFGLAVDHSARKLYWIDDVEGIHYKIERSNLDGTERAQFMNGTHQEPTYIAVDNEAVYWADSTSESVMKMKKNQGIDEKPQKISGNHLSQRGSHIMSIIAWDNLGSIDCEGIKAVKYRLQNPTTPNPRDKPTNDLSTRTEKIDSTTQLNESISVRDYSGNVNADGVPNTMSKPHAKSSNEKGNSVTQPNKNCMNEGRYNESTAECACKKGYTGALCEVSVCHNYCVHGSCEIDAGDSPKCVCDISYDGDRCDRDVCSGYCLNNGSCTASSSGPSCKCENSHGPRCEYTNELDKLCSLYCSETEEVMNSVSIAFCKCSEMNQTLQQEHFVAGEPPGPPIIIVSVLITAIVLLVIVVGALSYHVNKLRRRPRIRKRFVVSKGGVTPLTSRPQVPADSCEITIENCCNMNICETPCFEPKLRATPTKSSSSKTEEKNSLLDSMEGVDSC